MTKYPIWGFILILLFSFTLESDRNKQDIETVLGMGVITAPNSSMYSYAEIQIRHSTNKMVGFTPISRDAFLRKATGLWPSLANPNRINLFEENNIYCYPIYDSVKRKYTKFACDQILDMWRLRWKEHPYAHMEGPGWSNGQYKPSNAQSKYLYERYNNPGIMNNYFYGKHLFELFRDMQDSVWRKNYSQLNDSI